MASSPSLAQARTPSPAAATDGHLLGLAGDWSLWRDFAVRSAGFPVNGLELFGGEGESARLGTVAADPLFAEAVIWQNRSAYRTAVAKIAGRDAEPGNRRRQRDGVVAGYWQRYCAKNDTVGFFGPLAWGSIRDNGPAITVRSRGLIATRAFESWCLEALARAIDTRAVVPHNRRPELALRQQLQARLTSRRVARNARPAGASGSVVDATRSQPGRTDAALGGFADADGDMHGAQQDQGGAVPQRERRSDPYRSRALTAGRQVRP